MFMSHSQLLLIQEVNLRRSVEVRKYYLVNENSTFFRFPSSFRRGG